MSDNKIDKLLIAQLIGMIRADGIEKDSELYFLDRLASLLNTDLQITDSNPTFSESLVHKLNLDEKIIQFHRLVLLMKVDGQFDNDEINYIRKIGRILGLHPGAVKEVIEIQIKSKEKNIDSKSLIDLLKKDFN